MTSYVAVYERAEDGGWGGYLPDVPGVVALGSTEDVVVAGLQEALAAYADEKRELGRDFPAPMATTGTSRPDPGVAAAVSRRRLAPPCQHPSHGVGRG